MVVRDKSRTCEASRQGRPNKGMTLVCSSNFRLARAPTCWTGKHVTAAFGSECKQGTRTHHHSWLEGGLLLGGWVAPQRRLRAICLCRLGQHLRPNARTQNAGALPGCGSQRRSFAGCEHADASAHGGPTCAIRHGRGEHMAKNSCMLHQLLAGDAGGKPLQGKTCQDLPAQTANMALHATGLARGIQRCKQQ